MPRMRDTSENWASAIWERTGFWWWELMALFLWGRHFGTLVAEPFVQWSIGPLCAIIPRGSLRRNAFCARGAVNVAAFEETAVSLGLASPVLHCWSAQLREADLVENQSPCNASFTAGHLGPMFGGVAEHPVHPWPQVLSSLLYLHYCSPTKLRPHFVSIRQTKTIPTSILFTV